MREDVIIKRTKDSDDIGKNNLRIEDEIRKEIIIYVNQITEERKLKYLLAVAKKTKQMNM